MLEGTGSFSREVKLFKVIFSNLEKLFIQVWQHSPVQALKGLRQRDCSEFKDSLVYVASSSQPRLCCETAAPYTEEEKEKKEGVEERVGRACRGHFKRLTDMRHKLEITLPFSVLFRTLSYIKERHLW